MIRRLIKGLQLVLNAKLPPTSEDFHQVKQPEKYEMPLQGMA